MAIVVEDGTGLANAETFVSVAAADAYHLNRANAAWALLDTTAKEAALRKAADFMEQRYRLRWAGYRVNTVQALSWPRYEVPFSDSGWLHPAYYASDMVPAIVANACSELALRASAGELSPDVERAVSRETIGPITVEYESGSLQTTQFDAVEDMLRPLFKVGGGLFLPVTRV